MRNYFLRTASNLAYLSANQHWFTDHLVHDSASYLLDRIERRVMERAGKSIRAKMHKNMKETANG